jgi:hypothetical protein
MKLSVYTAKNGRLRYNIIRWFSIRRKIEAEVAQAA